MAGRRSVQEQLVDTGQVEGSPFRQAVRDIIEQGSRPAPPDPFGPVLSQATRQGVETIRAVDADAGEALAKVYQPHRPRRSREEQMETAVRQLRASPSGQESLARKLRDGELSDRAAARTRELFERAGIDPEDFDDDDAEEFDDDGEGFDGPWNEGYDERNPPAYVEDDDEEGDGADVDADTEVEAELDPWRMPGWRS
jgi:hypothetical protein